MTVFTGKTGALAVLAAVLTLLLYGSGLAGDFMFDDYWNILNNEQIQIDNVGPAALAAAAESGQAGPLKRPVAMVSFALNYYISGFDPRAFKAFNLGLHLCNGLLVLLVISQILALPAVRNGSGHVRGMEAYVALLVAALWLVHPLNLSSVLYIVQRMTQLATLFSLLALLCYLKGRMDLSNGGRRRLVWFPAALLCALLASFSKESGLLVPFYLLLIELTLFRGEMLERSARTFVRGFHAAFCLLPFLAVCVYVLFKPDFVMAGYAWRHFDLVERLLTESRVLWFYVRLVFLPDIASFGLFHDDFAVSRGLLSPWSTLLSLAAWVLVLVLLLSRRLPVLLTFGVSFFLLGHALESSVIGLELVHEHRNYFPQIGLLLCLAYYLLGREDPPLRIAVTVSVLFLLWLSVLTGLRAQAWSDLSSFSFSQYQHHPASARSNYQMGRIYARSVDAAASDEDRQKYFAEAINYFTRATELQTHYSEGLFGLLVLYSQQGIEPPEPLLSELRRRLSGEVFPVQNVNQINNLVRCEADGVCRLPPQVLPGLLRASRSNPSLSPMLAAMLPAGTATQ